jgi:hypothetical protein
MTFYNPNYSELSVQARRPISVQQPGIDPNYYFLKSIPFGSSQVDIYNPNVPNLYNRKSYVLMNGRIMRRPDIDLNKFADPHPEKVANFIEKLNSEDSTFIPSFEMQQSLNNQRAITDFIARKGKFDPEEKIADILKKIEAGDTLNPVEQETYNKYKIKPVNQGFVETLQKIGISSADITKAVSELKGISTGSLATQSAHQVALLDDIRAQLSSLADEIVTKTSASGTIKAADIKDLNLVEVVNTFTRSAEDIINKKNEIIEFIKTSSVSDDEKEEYYTSQKAQLEMKIELLCHEFKKLEDIPISDVKLIGLRERTLLLINDIIINATKSLLTKDECDKLIASVKKTSPTSVVAAIITPTVVKTPTPPPVIAPPSFRAPILTPAPIVFKAPSSPSAFIPAPPGPPPPPLDPSKPITRPIPIPGTPPSRPILSSLSSPRASVPSTTATPVTPTTPSRFSLAGLGSFISTPVKAIGSILTPTKEEEEEEEEEEIPITDVTDIGSADMTSGIISNSKYNDFEPIVANFENYRIDIVTDYANNLAPKYYDTSIIFDTIYIDSVTPASLVELFKKGYKYLIHNKYTKDRTVYPTADPIVRIEAARIIYRDENETGTRVSNQASVVLDNPYDFRIAKPIKFTTIKTGKDVVPLKNVVIDKRYEIVAKGAKKLQPINRRDFWRAYQYEKFKYEMSIDSKTA